MRSRFKRAPGVVFLMCILALLAGQAHPFAPSAATKPEPHDFERLNKDCKHCHAYAGVKSRGVMRKPVGEICAECHALTGHSHPVDLVPAMELPRDLPLDGNGMMTCATCHDVHRSYLNPATGERTLYLRRDGPMKLFCEACKKAS